MKKIIKTAIRWIGMIMGAMVLYNVLLVAFHVITHPTISIQPINKPIDSSVISAKQIEALLNGEIRKIKGLGKYDFVIGSINMDVNKEHKGKISATYVEREKESEQSKLIIVELDTQEEILYTIKDWGKESKLYPGILNLPDWNIDSTEAVRIAEEFFATHEGFRCDEIRLRSLADFLGSTERWCVYLIDKERNIRYEADLDPYTGIISRDHVTYLKE